MMTELDSRFIKYLFPHIKYNKKETFARKRRQLPFEIIESFIAKMLREEEKVLLYTEYTVETYLRIKNKDTYYISYLKTSFRVNGLSTNSNIDIEELTIERIYNTILENAYKFILFGTVSTDLLNMKGENVFIKDKYQGTEEERIQHVA